MAAAPNATQIIAPRVELVDPRTGLMSREWYRFFYNLYEIAGAGEGIIPVSRGGTGTNVAPAAGRLLIGNGAGYTVNPLTAGAGISVLNAPGDITLVNSGVLSFSAGTTGLTPSTGTTGAVTLAGVLDITNGGTNATNATDARANLSAAGLGANDDITSMSALTGGVETPTYIQMDVTAVETPATGKFNWNPTDQTLDVGMDYGVVQQIGQEQYARVGNTTGATIPNGAVVSFAGATAGAILVEPYLADGTQPSSYILGVMTHDLPDSGEKGYCTTFGFVRGVDTSAFTQGDLLYASPTVAGALTKVKPTAPNNVIVLAVCVISDATDGVVFVRPIITPMQYYGEFSKTTDQSPAAINTEGLLTFDVTKITNGVIIGTPTSRIVVPASGFYQFSATVQISGGDSLQKYMWVWFKKNGTTIPDSARIVTSDINNGYTTLALVESVSLNANDYVEMAFAADSTNIKLDSVAATAFAPVAPAIVLQVTQVQQ